MSSSPHDSLERPGGASLAYVRTAGGGPGVVFCGGFRSDMGGTKALFLEGLCRARGLAHVRFDYSGHGRSGGRFEDGTIGGWRDDVLAVLDRLTEGPQVLVGSSMGGWLATLAALARPDRVAGLVGVAAAPDFTEELIWDRLELPARAALMRDGVLRLPSAYDPAGTPVTRRLIEEGRTHRLLAGPVPFAGPVRLLHGLADAEVPWRQSLHLAEALVGPDVRLTLIKDGDHRLSRDADLELLGQAVAEVAGRIRAG